MTMRVMKGSQTRCWAAVGSLLLVGCAHDPAPKAHCHGPWIWLTPAGGTPAVGIPAKQSTRPQDAHRTPPASPFGDRPRAAPGDAPAQPGDAGHL
jgi:hypothetical protein